MGVAEDLFSEGDFVDVRVDDETDDATGDNEVVASFDAVWVVDSSNRLDVGRVCIGMVA